MSTNEEEKKLKMEHVKETAQIKIDLRKDIIPTMGMTIVVSEMIEDALKNIRYRR